MIIGRVIGNVWSTRKDERLNGLKLMLVKPIDEKRREIGALMVAADNAGSGIGDMVLITRGGSARACLSQRDIPVDAIIVGVVDSMDLDKD